MTPLVPRPKNIERKVASLIKIRLSVCHAVRRPITVGQAASAFTWHRLISRHSNPRVRAVESTTDGNNDGRGQSLGGWVATEGIYGPQQMPYTPCNGLLECGIYKQARVSIQFRQAISHFVRVIAWVWLVRCQLARVIVYRWSQTKILMALLNVM